MQMVWEPLVVLFFEQKVSEPVIKYSIEDKYIGKVIEYGQCPDTDTLGISESINHTKEMFNESNIHNYINSLKKYFYILIIQNIADISTKLIFLLCF